MPEIFNDRERAGSFGADAERYDRSRPSYPAELVDWLTDGSPGRAVDVGCGTGKLTLVLQRGGWDVVGVEADSRMAAVARRHGLRVDVSTFEAWQTDARFDLVTSAQAWHWIDPAVGYAKAAELLSNRGKLALVWHSYSYEARILSVFRDVFGRHAAELLEQAVPLGTAQLDHDTLDAEVTDRLRGHFEAPVTRVFVHDRIQAVSNWLDELRSHSPIAVLPAAQREILVEELADRLAAATGTHLNVTYRARTTTAVRT